MKTIVRKYKGKSVTFLLDPVDDNIMVNATEMANHYGKCVSQYFKLKHTMDFVGIMLKDETLRKNDPNNRLDSILQNIDNGQIYVHQFLASDFADLMDKHFHFWINSSITSIWQELLEEAVSAIEFLEKIKNV